jgi:hypothetical protein
MAKISEKPAGLPSTNALDGLPAEEPAEVRLAGKTLCVLADPPQLGGNVELMVRLHITEDCIAQHDDGNEVRYLKARLVGAWRPGSPPPVDVNQPDLWEQAPPEGSIKPETAT